jgi:hypothetical protein
MSKRSKKIQSENLSDEAENNVSDPENPPKEKKTQTKKKSINKKRSEGEGKKKNPKSKDDTKTTTKSNPKKRAKTQGEEKKDNGKDYGSDKENKNSSGKQTDEEVDLPTDCKENDNVKPEPFKIYYPDKSVKVLEKKRSGERLEQLQEIVGGRIEVLPIGETQIVMVIDEDGTYKHEYNPVASSFDYRFNQLFGPVIVVPATYL